MGLILRIPCDSKERTAALFNRSGKMSDGQRAAMEQKAHCDKFTEPTEEEIAADEAEMDRHMQRMQLTFAVIARVKKKHDKSWSGVEKCPVCGNKLHLQLNVFFSEYQGEHQKHLHGRCETQGCVAWME